MITYKTLREYISSFSEEQLAKIPRIRSGVYLHKYIKVVVRCREKTHSPIWVYIGSLNDHLIIPRTFCSCKHFVIRVMSEKKSPGCHHILGQMLAEKNGQYRIVYVDERELLNIVNEVIHYGRSKTLRRKIIHLYRNK